MQSLRVRISNEMPTLLLTLSDVCERIEVVIFHLSFAPHVSLRFTVMLPSRQGRLQLAFTCLTVVACVDYGIVMGFHDTRTSNIRAGPAKGARYLGQAIRRGKSES